jgi:hypothetical protein
MRKISLVLAAALVGSAAMQAADRDFNAVARGLESNLGIRRMHMPLFGLAMFVAKAAAVTQGVHQLNIAVYEDLDYTPPSIERFDQIMKAAVGERWTSFVRVRSKGDGEYTYLYLRPDGRDWRMLVATFEPHEAVLVHLKLNPEMLMRDLDDPAHAGRRGRWDDEK